LHHLLGTRIAEAVITDPAWPGLVAAVTASDWPPHGLLAAAAEHLHDIAATQTIRPDEYARLLTYRVELLTHHAATLDPDIPHPAEQAETPTSQKQFDLDTHNIPDQDLHEPPPDPDDYPYGFVEDDLTGLDITDLPTARPPAPVRLDDVDIPALRARRDAAHQHAQQLAAAILTGGGGPAEHAATAELAELRRRLLEQRPYQQALAQAHARWVHAEDTAELHRQLLTQLSAAITAATERGEHDAAARYRQHHTQVSEQTQRVDTAVRTARARLDSARAELINTAGGVAGIVTEQHLHDRRARALRADTDTLNAARRRARDLDDQLARAEAAAARSLAQSPAHTYDLGADLDQLQAEVDFLQAASAASPAAMYTPPPAALEGLDDEHRRAVNALTSNIHSVQLLHLHPGADKTATLAALADTAHHHNKRVLALTGTDGAAARAYADTTATIDSYRDDVTSRRQTLPLGGLVIVDDAQALTAAQLRWLAHSAADTNTKLLITTSGEQQPAHTLLTVLTNNLPYTQHLGTPDPDHRQPCTAIDRAEHHLATTSAASPDRIRAAQLLRQRNHVLAQLRDIVNTTTRLDAITEHDRARAHGRRQDRGNGFEL
ncbi:MAG TPA: AAA family ATPase, partial [Mycobacterium sp.]|nr:AAA family ATPase [Mycobacterium sp.]